MGPIPAKMYGRFFEGDSYVVLYVCMKCSYFLTTLLEKNFLGEGRCEDGDEHVNLESNIIIS